MARIPMVTRTITTTVANVLCVDIETSEPMNKEFTLPRTYKDEKAMLKYIEKNIELGSLKPVHVVDTDVVETLYGMTEQEFVEKATVLPPRKETETEA